MNNPNINITNIPSATEGEGIIIDETTDINEDITFTYTNANGEVISVFDLPEAQINIFDSQYYTANNPDVAESLTTEYANASTSIRVSNVNAPVLGISDLNQAQTVDVPEDIINFPEDIEDIVNVPEDIDRPSTLDYSVALEDYVTSGAAEGQDPSPLFNSEYYLEQNPDVAEALAGGDFNGDPLLHYVETGAAEGLDPNAYFDSDYYLAENPGVAETGLNPLEHYVLLGSSQGTDPSANFDPEYYLAQNPDIAAAGVDPLTHFLTFGQDEGRSPIA